MAIDIKNLSYRYPDGTLALRELSLKIGQGKKLAILGANGSGKSTLLQHLNGLLRPETGSIRVGELELKKENLDLVRKKVGFVFDNPDDQLFATTVFEDIAFGPRNLLLEEAEVEKRVDQVLDIVGITSLRDRQPHNLSLGQKRKVAIAGVLAMEPDILVFDEPFSGLDPVSLNQFIDILNRLGQLGHSLIVTTHDVDIAYAWAENIALIKEGRLLKEGDLSLLEDEELLKEANLRPPMLYEVFLDTDLRPRSKEEARQAIKDMYNRRNSNE